MSSTRPALIKINDKSEAKSEGKEHPIPSEEEEEEGGEEKKKKKKTTTKERCRERERATALGREGIVECARAVHRTVSETA